ncbi:MAG: hypothetical protein H6696_09560 [Deferribacteres bacterium]|nr:hypothetical protein [candidate division KSB1 bacterium]MCB9502173.1 hypothetical protein [Deferribacteres bacterium]
MKRKSLHLITIFLLMTSLLQAQSFKNFITVDGAKIMDGKEQFRFLSFNIPNLNFVEDNLDFKTVYPFRLPTEFEIRDALMSVKQMGGRVVRIYTLPVRFLSFPDSVPAYVTGPGEFNEDAFKVNDLMLAIANELGIRIIFPLLNEWKWLGGKPQYAAFRNKSETEFYTDRQLIDDFKKTIEFTLNRKNTITGVKYKDDKAILCWETGNELLCPHEWTVEITRYIKKLDNNHLVLDGYHAIDSRPLREQSVLEPSIDIIHSHHYVTNPIELCEHIDRNLEIINGRKPYIIGEFGFESTASLEMVIDKIINTPEISGGLIWSLRSHREEGGFYWHSEPLGMGIYKSYHWPGFASGNSYDERNFLAMLREKAFSIQRLEAPVIPVPQAPVLLPITEIYKINWQGSVGASGYNIERATGTNGPWEQIGFNISDAALPYFPLFHDESAKIEETYYYRTQAINASGFSAYSNVVGPIKVEKQALIDNMQNYGKNILSKDVTIVTGNDRKCKEKMERMNGDNGSELLYRTDVPIKSFTIYSFEYVEQTALKLSVSHDGIEFEIIVPDTSWHHEPGNDYGYNFPVCYTYATDEDEYQFLKIEFLREAEIARVEIIY